MSLSDVRRKVAEVMGSEDMRKCRSCGQSAKHETLADHGGMCFPCFAAYCRMPKTAPRGGGLTGWADVLRERHQAGERLTPVQIDMYRDGLRKAHGVLDAAKAGATVPVAAITESLRVTGDIPPPWLDDVPVFEDS